MGLIWTLGNLLKAPQYQLLRRYCEYQDMSLSISPLSTPKENKFPTDSRQVLYLSKGWADTVVYLLLLLRLLFIPKNSVISHCVVIPKVMEPNEMTVVIAVPIVAVLVGVVVFCCWCCWWFCCCYNSRDNFVTLSFSV